MKISLALMRDSHNTTTGETLILSDTLQDDWVRLSLSDSDRVVEVKVDELRRAITALFMAENMK